MKRIITITVIILASTSFAMANIYVDGIFMLNDAGDAKLQNGFGLKIAASIRDDINIFYRQTFTTTTEDPDTIYETEYMQIQGLVGGEYLYFIKQFPVAVSLSAAAGVSRTEVKPKNDWVGIEDLGETGIGYGFWVGSQWLLTQWVAPFIEFGYSKSLYTTDFKNASIGGLQFLVGVRFTLWGKNKSLTEDYE
ncbi:MAG: hypothetical protein N3F66_06100 [Spirochaetes bacterium]|nr:hypothetical protein [Spirochaetota bacterium]